MSEKKKESRFEPFRTIIIAGALALCFRSLMFEPFNIPSGSMIPTLKVGDYLFVSKFSYGYSRYSFPFAAIPFEGRLFGGSPDRGDVVVFRQPNNESVAFIKRVVGLPGDRVAVKKGILHINDKPVTRTHSGSATGSNGFAVMKYDEFEEVFPNGHTHSIREMRDDGTLDNTRTFVVPDDHFFMMGDNRDNSNDSRTPSVGMVPYENLIGEAQFLFFSHNGTARIWEIWKWPFAIRYGRIGDGIT